MRAFKIAWLASCALLICTSAAAQDAATQALDDCIAKVEKALAEPKPGFNLVGELCPDLKTIMERSPVASWLPEEWWGPMLNPDSLRALRQLAVNEPERHDTATIDTNGVGSALASLGENADDQLSWWERLREWVRSRLQTKSEDQPDWFYKWIDELAKHQTVVRVIGYTLFGLIVLSAVLIVLNELRAAGVFGARWQKAGRSSAALTAAATPAATLDDLDRSAPEIRPAILLNLLLAALARRENRGVDRSFTHRELAARVPLADDSQRSAFGRLARCAERVRYAAALPSRGEIDEAVSGGRRLLEVLSLQPGTSGA